MTTVDIRASQPYQVHIGPGLLDQVGEQARALWTGPTAAVVSDSNVAPLYLSRCTASLEAAGFRVVPFVFPAGEASKNGQTYLALLECLAEHHITRADGLVALGGGVVGDLTGFAAATFLRGVAFLQLPTTLLAAVDASVGGKTAIDLHHGKNLAGAFYQPKAVLCDPSVLDTLPPADFADGCAEVIKYGMIGDPALLDILEAPGPLDVETVIARCVEQKGRLVEADEFDTGARQLLNLGHTIGHGVEACSGYAISHGKAVAIGMVLITRAAVHFGLCPAAVLPRLQALLEAYRLPQSTEYSAQALYTKTLSDKKRSGDALSLVVPTTWGESRLHSVPVASLLSWIEKGLQA